MGKFAALRGDTSGRGLLREGEQLKFAFIHAEKAVFPITAMCSMLEVSRAGYYASVDRPPSAHATEDQRLTVRVREIHELTKKRYGAPRVQRELAKAEDIHVSQKRVARLMRQDGLRARPRRRFKSTTMSDHDQPVAANLLDRNFEAVAPDQKWVGDTTELLTGNGKLFLAVILDLYSKFVVGWALSPVNDRHLTIAALEMAIKRRCPGLGLLHHSDQGCTYASEDYQKILAERGVICSMSRRGNPYDNAVMEAWNSTFKFECGERFLNNEVARNETFDFIEVFYNQKRLHSTIGYVSPAEFESAFVKRQAA